MIDLSIAIRKHLLTIQDFIDIIAPYKNSYSVFTYRPVPEDATYPMSVISTTLGGADSDYINCFKRNIQYNVIVYDKNLSPQNYVNIENVANSIARSFHRLSPTSLDLSGVKVVSVTASNPFPAPTDDNETIARAITLNFEVKY